VTLDYAVWAVLAVFKLDKMILYDNSWILCIAKNLCFLSTKESYSRPELNTMIFGPSAICLPYCVKSSLLRFQSSFVDIKVRSHEKGQIKWKEWTRYFLYPNQVPVLAL